MCPHFFKQCLTLINGKPHDIGIIAAARIKRLSAGFQIDAHQQMHGTWDLRDVTVVLFETVAQLSGGIAAGIMLAA